MKMSKSLIILEQVHSDIERHERFDSLDESIIGGRLSDYLILEAEKQSPEEVKKKIKDAANQARQELDKLRDVSKKLGNLKSINDAIERLTDELSESTQDIDAADIAKGGLKNKIFRSGLEKLTVASAAISSLEKSIKTGVENLFNAIKVRIDPKDKAYADKSVRDIVGGNTARLNQVVASIQKSIGGEDKGFFGNLGRSIKSFFSKARGTVLPKIDAKQYAEDLLDVKLSVLNQYTDSPVAADADNVKKDASGTLDQVLSDTPELAAPPEKTSNGGGKSDSGGVSQKGSSEGSDKEDSVKVDRAQNVGSFKRPDWTKLVNDDPDDFVKKVNDIAGKKVLENKKNIISESRWAQLAGIKEDE
jgi:hypothetical protein